jgi:hypothetical protein
MKLYLTGAMLVEVGHTSPSLRALPVRLAWLLLPDSGGEKEVVTSEKQAERDNPGTDSPKHRL